MMVGIRNSVLSHVREKQGNIFSLACVRHLAALSAASGLKALPFSVDILLIDVHFYSSKSKGLQGYCPTARPVLHGG